VPGPVSVSAADDVSANWERIRKTDHSERAAPAKPTVASVPGGVASGLPVLSLAAQLRPAGSLVLMAQVVGQLPPAEPVLAGPDDVGQQAARAEQFVPAGRGSGQGGRSKQRCVPMISVVSPVN
jgi:hypothetical protein